MVCINSTSFQQIFSLITVFNAAVQRINAIIVSNLYGWYLILNLKKNSYKLLEAKSLFHGYPLGTAKGFGQPLEDQKYTKSVKA